MKSWKHLLVVAVSLLAGVGRAAEPTKDSLDKVKENLAAKKAVIIDVRSRNEWDHGHLKDAQLIPLPELKKAAKDPAAKEKLASELPKDKIIYCHCAKGVRALLAANILEGMKYDVRALEPGYDALRDAGFPVVVPK